MSPTIITPQKECEYLEICNFKEGILSNCNIWSQKTDRCMIFKLMKEVQELKDIVKETKDIEIFRELTGQ